MQLGRFDSEKYLFWGLLQMLLLSKLEGRGEVGPLGLPDDDDGGGGGLVAILVL